MKYDVEQIAKDVKAACAAAQEFAATEDGGTSNFDAAIIYAPGIKEAQAQQIRQAGGDVFLSSDRLRGRYLSIGGTLGQGNRRTRMAQAIEKSLAAAGYKTGMYYAMD